MGVPVPGEGYRRLRGDDDASRIGIGHAIGCGSGWLRRGISPWPSQSCTRHQTAFAQGDNTVVEPGNEGEIVAGNKHCHAHLAEFFKQGHDLSRQCRVKISRGLIGQQDFWPANHGPGNSHALLFTPGQRYRHGPLFVQQAHFIQRSTYSATHFPMIIATNNKRQRHIVEHITIK